MPQDEEYSQQNNNLRVSLERVPRGDGDALYSIKGNALRGYLTFKLLLPLYINFMMNIFVKRILPIVLFLPLIANAQKKRVYEGIYSGVPWFDNRGKSVSAHGANIIKDYGRYYLFGERQSDTNNAFTGFSCYSSTDLYNWRFESIALPVQDSGKLGPNRRGERPKVMKCPATGEYIMYMHVDNLAHTDQLVGYATSNNITGPYTYHGPLFFNGAVIRKWDMGAFQDDDGSGYVLLHGGDIYRLSDDYKRIVEHVHKANIPGFESPAIFRKDGVYYFLGSQLTSWERNDNDYYTATSLKGPWTKRGMFCPQGTLTWNSQCTFVLPVAGSKDTTFMYMGDRWAYPIQESAATYVWQPLTISGTSISIPKFLDAWRIEMATGESKLVELPEKFIENADSKIISYSGNWKHTKDSLSLSSSDRKGDRLSVKFRGRQIALYGLSRSEGGHAQIDLRNKKGKLVFSGLVDMYCKYPIASLEYITPVLKKADYTLTLTVKGEHGNWSDKRKNVFGSTGNVISIDKIAVNP